MNLIPRRADSGPARLCCYSSWPGLLSRPSTKIPNLPYWSPLIVGAIVCLKMVARVPMFGVVYDL
jgi:hypothetical protein